MLLNQISQSVKNLNAGDSNQSDPNISIDIPGIDVGISLPDLFPSGTSNPQTPTSIREVLQTLLNQQVEVTTAFDTITGTLAAVQDDYIVMVEGDGSLVLVPIDQIESVSEL